MVRGGGDDGDRRASAIYRRREALVPRRGIDPFASAGVLSISRCAQTTSESSSTLFFFGRPGVPNPPEIREASHHFQHLAVSIDSLPSQGVGVGPKYANENAHQYANEETPRACLLGLSFLP